MHDTTIDTTARIEPLLKSGFTTLAVGAGLEAVARLLYVPWWDEPDRYVEEIADGRATHLAGAALSFVAAVVIAAGLLRLWMASHHLGATPRRALTAALLLPVGLGGVAAVAYTAGSFGRDGHVAEGVTVWGDVWDHGGADLGWYGAIIGALALIVALVSLARRGVVPRLPAGLLGLGALTTAVTSAGPITAILVTTALLFTTGAAWTAVRTADTPNGTER